MLIHWLEIYPLSSAIQNWESQGLIGLFKPSNTEFKDHKAKVYFL